MKKKKFVLVALSVLILAGISYGVYHRQSKRFTGRVGLVSLGKTESGEVAFVKQEIEQFYGFSVRLLPAKTLPQEAYYAPRQRYKAALLLRYLARIKPQEEDKIIALLEKDISVKTEKQEDWGVMGLAWLGGCCCVVSTFRLVRDHPSQAKFRERLAKVSLHEVGHTLGLEHCTFSNQCLMQDANGSIRTIDREKKELCGQCQQKIEYTQM